MFIKHKPSGDLVEVMSVGHLIDPFEATIVGRFQAGEERQEPCELKKIELIFPSDEKLPDCWLDPHYRSLERRH